MADFSVEPSDLKVDQAYRPGKDPFGRTRVIAEISNTGDYLAWESTDGVEYSTQHTRQFCNFASGPHGGLVDLTVKTEDDIA